MKLLILNIRNPFTIESCGCSNNMQSYSEKLVKIHIAAGLGYKQWLAKEYKGILYLFIFFGKHFNDKIMEKGLHMS